MKYILYIYLLLFTVSCSKDYRAGRKISKLQSWGYLKTDTIWKTDTIKGFRVDTVVRFDTTHTQDTLEVIKDGVRSVTVIKWKERLITQEITKQDTIIKYIKSVTTVNNPEKCSHTMCWVKFWIVVALLAGSIFSRFRK